MTAEAACNRLANEKNPYLLRHATNPVDWFPWGEEAFAKASTEQKPADSFPLTAAYHKFASLFDAEYGGFGNAAKFPKPHILMFLMRYWHQTGEPQALAMVEKTLHAMRLGAIYDQLGYGFHRYTTDRGWHIPHFEKMLYDQALLTIAYLEAYQVTRNPEYAETAREIISYVFREMTSAEGPFYSAQSTDSEGKEGKFYLWREEEFRQILGVRDTETAMRIFNVIKDGNFLDPVKGEKTGANVLYRHEGVELPAGFADIRAKLLKARAGRPRPALDDKVLTDLNGLMIAALARAALTLDEPSYGEAAVRAADFILKHMKDPEGRLLHLWHQGEAGLTATAADYAYLIWGLTELYEWSFDARWLENSLQLGNDFLEHFWDRQDGGFFLTPWDGDPILVRPKSVLDQALPSANSVALLDLLRLSRLTAKTDFEEKAAALIHTFSGAIEKTPADSPMFLAAMAFTLWSSHEVVIVGNRHEDDTKAMLKAIRDGFHPDTVVQFRPAAEDNPPILQYAPFMEFMSAINGKSTAYVCTDFNCKFPTTDIARILHLLQPPERRK